MSYNTKAIKKDLDNKPVPQIFNPTIDDYEVQQGRNGAGRVELYGPDGNPLSTTSGKLDVRASELETLLSALGAKDFATQATLAAVLAKLSADPATQTTLDAVLAKLNAGITTTATLSGSNVDLRGLASERPAAAVANKDKTYWATDTGEVSVSTGTAWRALGVA